MGCAIPQSDGSWIIVVMPPSSWNDHIALMVWGHELAHVFGGWHE